MHMQRDPQTMQFNPEYVDVVADVRLFLAERAKEVEASGVSAEQIILDPGFGFGKNLEHNLRMLREFGSFTELGYPVLLGISRKSMLGKISGKEVHERLAPGIAATIMAVEQGAAVVRTHDVPETFDALRLWEAARVL
jgi:dihydropteroate synthase